MLINAPVARPSTAVNLSAPQLSRVRPGHGSLLGKLLRCLQVDLSLQCSIPAFIALGGRAFLGAGQ